MCWRQYYWVFADSRTGNVVLFSNSIRVDDQVNRRNRSGTFEYLGPVRARSFLEVNADLLGITPSATLHRFDLKRDGEVKDRNSCGYFGATFIRDSRIVATLTFDIKDGAPVLITMH